MILIKSFVTGVLRDLFNSFAHEIIEVYLTEVDKIRKYYSCLKLMIEAHLQVAFFPLFLIKYVLLKFVEGSL